MSKVLEFRCIVPSCESVNNQSIKSNVRVFPLPKTLSVRSKWLSCIPGVKKRLKSTSGICSLHFYMRDFNTKDELHPESVPHPFATDEEENESQIQSLSDLADQLEMNPEVIPSKVQHLVSQGEYTFYKIEFHSKGTPQVEYSVHIYSDLSFDAFHRSSPKRIQLKGVVIRDLEEIRDVLEELESIPTPSHTKDRITQTLDLLSQELEEVPYSVGRKLEFIIDQLKNVGIKSKNMNFTEKSIASFKELQVMPVSLYKLLGCNLALPDMSEHSDNNLKELKDFCQTYVENSEFRKNNQLKEDLLSRIFEKASPVTDVVGKTLNKLWSGHIDDYRTDLCLTSFLLLTEIYSYYLEKNAEDPLMSIEEGETANEVIIKEEVLEEPERFSPENIIVESDDTFLFPFNEKVKAVYSCCFCPVKLSTMEETLSHCGDEHAGFDVVVKIKPGPIVTIKSSLNELSCVDCKTDHVTVEEMSSHVNYHTHLVHSQSRTNNKKILRQTCSICKVGFIDKYRLRSHYASAHPNNSIFECKKCSQIFHKCSEYLKHKLYSHKKRPVNPDRLYDCDLCEKKFREKSLLDRHYARDHLHRKYICDICEKEFDMQRYLTKHKARVHPESFDYVCEFCGKKFAINEYLNSHKKICKFRSPKQMNEDNDFQCSKCGKCFTNEIFLLNHSAMVHDKKRKDNHCVTCDKYFVNPISLRHHMSTHDENRPKYSCDFCNKEYLSKSTLHFHVLSNHSTKAPDKTFKCDYCDWSFWENKRLRSHVKHVHNKVRDYKCDICDRAFGCKRHLIRHKTTIHEKFREFKCHLCSVEYFQKISLKNHLKKIHLVTDYMPPKQTKEI